MNVSALGCGPATWEKQENTRASGGVGYQAIDNVEDCLAECVSNTDCYGADIDNREGQTLCWLHLDEGNLETTSSFTDIDHYVLLDRCPPPG